MRLERRITGELYPSGRTHTFTYDAASRRLTAADPAGVTTFTYNPRGETSSVVDTFGKTLTYTYDPASRRATMEGRSGTTTYLYVTEL